MKRAKDFLLQNVGGKDLLVPLGAQVMDTNAIIILNPTGRCVWELLSEERSEEELALAIAEEFDVDVDRACLDVRAFLNEIRGMGLLET